MKESVAVKTIYLNGENLGLENLIKVSRSNPLRGGLVVDFHKEVWGKIDEFRIGLLNYLYEKPEVQIYGVNTNCGDLLDNGLESKAREEYIKALKAHKANLDDPEMKKKRDDIFGIYLKALEDYQERYLKAHNCGTGSPLPIEVVRAIMIIRLNSFAKGFSAVSKQMCKFLLDMLNLGVTPWVLEEGSVGASGDLIPLAMIGATMVGLPEAKAYYWNDDTDEYDLMKASKALEKAGLKPIRLGLKEAMGLTNGSNYIAAMTAFSIADAENLLKNSSVSAALSLEAIRGERDAFSEEVANARPHRGQLEIAGQMRSLLEGSRRTGRDAQRYRFPGQFEETVRPRIQDRYSFRAIPQVHGAAYEALEKAKDVLLTEINSATDNPLLFEDKNKPGEFFAISGANFHGQPLAVVIDYLKIAMTGMALVTDKRTFSMLDKNQSFGLPADLAPTGMKSNTGLMIAQYAGAARAAESRILSTPCSVMSITTSANQEDFVSMGSIGAVHLRKIIYNTTILVAVELLCAFRALQMTHDWLPAEYRNPGLRIGRVYKYLAESLSPVKEDCYLRTDIELFVEMVKTGKIIELVKEVFQKGKIQTL